MHEFTEPIEQLALKYHDKPAMMVKLKSLLTDHVPAALQEYEIRSQERAERDCLVTNACTEFETQFLSRRPYFRCEGSGVFVLYDGVHVVGQDEDDIQHEIFRAITGCPLVRQRKHKTKVRIMSRIKRRSTIALVPEGPTISYVIACLHPAYFITVSGVKHFLTAVGDSLLGKRELTYIYPPVLKDIIGALDDAAADTLGISAAFQTFKQKYHAHDYPTTRFFHCEWARSPLTLSKNLRRYILDVLCVSLHFSRTHGSADGYVEQSPCDGLADTALFTSDLTRETLVKGFVLTAITSCANEGMTDREMWFVLKEYLEQYHVPAIIFQDEFRSLLREHIPFDQKEGNYKGYTSKHLPLVRQFTNFWESTMIASAGKLAHIDVDDLITLFRQRHPRIPRTRGAEYFVSLVKCLYPTVSITQQRIIGFRNTAWQKDNICQTSLYTCADYPKQPDSLAQCYDIYLETARTPAMKRTDFIETIHSMYPDHTCPLGQLKEGFWALASTTECPSTPTSTPSACPSTCTTAERD